MTIRSSLPAALALLLLLGAAVVEKVDARPAARWRLDEAAGSTIAHDDVGALNGALLGTAEFTPDGISGGALRLGYGGAGVVDMGGVLAFGDEDFSIVLWMRTEPGASSAMYPLSKHASGYGGYLVGVNNDAYYGRPGKAWFYDIGSPGRQAFSETDVNDGEWHQLACVYRKDGWLAIYVDGAPREDLHQAPLNPVTGARFLIGGIDIGGNPTGYYQGSIDEVQVYDEALSADQVGFLFEHPETLVSDPDVPVAEGRRLWFRADAASDAGDGGPVPGWFDRSGQGLHVAQSAVGSQPVYVADALNGRPSIRFNGAQQLTRDSVVGSQIMSLDSATVFVVGRQDGADAWNTAIAWGVSSNRFYVHFTWEDWLVFQHGAPTGVGGYGSWYQPEGWDDAFHVVEMRREGSAFGCRVDGVDLATQTGGDSPELWESHTLYVGSDAWGNTLSGDLCEILVYDRALDVAELDAVRGYLGSRYYGPAGIQDRPDRRSVGIVRITPSPVTSEARISFDLDHASPVALAIFDVLGRPVRTLVSSSVAAGRHDVRWDGRLDEGRVADSGMYFVRLATAGGIRTERILFLR